MRVTLGLPFYNDADYLPDCLRSVFAQTEQDWELLLVNDGSTDGSLDIARSIDDPRVRLIDDGKNLGLAARLNQIAELARGEFVARQDADDLMHPQRLAEQLQALAADRSLDAVGSSTLIIDEHSRVLGMHGGSSADFRPKNVLQRVPLVHATLVGKRGWWRRNPYNPQLKRSQDRDFWIRTILDRGSSVAMLPQPRYYYRIGYRSDAVTTLRSYRNNRAILRRHAPAHVGWLQTAAWLAKSYAKSMVWGLASQCGLNRFLSQSRATPIPPAEVSEHQQRIEELRRVTLPLMKAAA